jgi:ferrochelatase
MRPARRAAPPQESGVRHWRRVPALNTDATFIDDLADAVIEALPYVSNFGGRSSATIGSGGAGATTDASVPIGGAQGMSQL